LAAASLYRHCRRSLPRVEMIAETLALDDRVSKKKKKKKY